MDRVNEGQNAEPQRIWNVFVIHLRMKGDRLKQHSPWKRHGWTQSIDPGLRWGSNGVISECPGHLGLLLSCPMTQRIASGDVVSAFHETGVCKQSLGLVCKPGAQLSWLWGCQASCLARSCKTAGWKPTGPTGWKPVPRRNRVCKQALTINPHHAYEMHRL